ncbi:Xanthine/uracil permease [Halalkaliarchaeum sp. AArc-CO]|uniref:uracil-xanthine permease family protein n=1 Tax=unclassified Halalkaliarchaeum TaxID=2678344 RepID=UPI00217EA07A|nr:MULTISPECIES: solute carrier family 23 protein [unclassified Halalkaliarchaeum]MDR5672983.1 solute carrier family 23 protein [Halalkaliarchaeum sp. AArc-GB]UWG50325.1 Xanthine/uracil permease [Halalkaliarchaeum sp. AArc-CO]
MSRDEATFVEYGIDDKPPLSTSLGLGVQHYLTMVGANIAVPLLLAGALGMPQELWGRFIGTFFVVSGIATLAQTTFGNRYPIVQGAPFSLLAPALAVIGVAQATGHDWNGALLQLQGAIVAAAMVEVAVGYFGLVGKVREYLSPVVIAPTIALIGLALFDAPQVSTATQDWWLLGLTLVLIVGFSQYLDAAHRAFRLYPVVLGIVGAYLVALALSVTGHYAPGMPGYVEHGIDVWMEGGLVMAIYPLQWGTAIGFETAFIIGMLAGIAASIIESLGDYYAVARLSGSAAPSAKRINHGIGMEGLMNVFSGLMGTGGSTSYSENIGAIGLTGVASRYVVQVGAAVMLVVGFLGPFGNLIRTIPDPIVGGLYVAMFGQIVAVGLANLKHVDLESQRNLFVVGLAMFTGLAVPAYMDNVGDVEALQQGMAEVTLLGPVLGTEAISTTIFVIGSTGMAVGGLVALLLDNTIEGTREERGLEEWEKTAETDSQFVSAYDRFVRSND